MKYVLDASQLRLIDINEIEPGDICLQGPAFQPERLLSIFTLAPDENAFALVHLEGEHQLVLQGGRRPHPGTEFVLRLPRGRLNVELPNPLRAEEGGFRHPGNLLVGETGAYLCIQVHSMGFLHPCYLKLSDWSPTREVPRGSSAYSTWRLLLELEKTEITLLERGAWPARL